MKRRIPLVPLLLLAHPAAAIARTRPDPDLLVTPTLERWKREGAVALKFSLACMRPLSFADVPEGRARPVYERYAGAGTPKPEEYTALQDRTSGRTSPCSRLFARRASRRGSSRAWCFGRTRGACSS